jgi:hypothetical protein
MFSMLTVVLPTAFLSIGVLVACFVFWVVFVVGTSFVPCRFCGWDRFCVGDRYLDGGINFD